MGFDYCSPRCIAQHRKADFDPAACEPKREPLHLILYRVAQLQGSTVLEALRAVEALRRD